MTDREKAIVMAHTGICMLAGEKFGVFHAYIEDIMGRPVYTHELAIQSISDEIKEKSRDDFMKLCMEEQEPCEDCVSRKSIKQKLQEHHDFFVNAYGGFSNLPQNDKSRVDEITNCIAMVVNEPPVNPQSKTGHWIPVSERLPKAGEYIGNAARYYLVQNEYGDMLVARYTHGEYWEQGYQLKPIGDEIVAWMPLPTPYDPKESEE